MSDRSQPHQVQVHTQSRHEGGLPHHKGHLYPPPDYNHNQRSPSTPQLLALLAGLPVGGTLLALAGLTLLVTFIGLAVATPLFIIFSPVLVPATIVLGLAVAGFLSSGAAGLTGLSSFSWVMNYIRQTQGTMPDQFDHAKWKMADMAGYVGQKTKEVGQDIQTRAHDAKRTST